MRHGPPTRTDAPLFVAVLWVWGLMSAYFWCLAEDVGAVLPHVPTAVWAGPGKLWRLHPGLLVLVLGAMSFLVVRQSAQLRSLRPLLYGAIGVVGLVVVVWGVALFAATRDTGRG